MSHRVVMSQYTDNDYSEREVMPKKRTQKVAWYIVSFLATVGTIIYALHYNMETKFDPTTDLYAAIAQNKTPTCYQRVEKKTYPVLISLGMGLLGVLLAPFIRRLCDLVDELRQFQSRYKGDFCKLCKACFSGISYKSVIAVAVVDGIAVWLRQTLSLNDIMLILGGISVGPLVTILLELNAPSAVDRSRESEKEKSSLPYILAYIFHFHFLPNASLAFAKRFPDSNLTVRLDEDQRLNESSDQVQLHLNKLILLFSADFQKGAELSELDNHIRKITDVNEGKYKVSIYGLKYKGNEYNFVILYAEEYLEIIKEMCRSEACKAVHLSQVEELVKLMFGTVCEYLNGNDHPRKCIPVLVSASKGFENGGLAKQIMFSVQRFVTEKESVTDEEPVTEEESPAISSPTTPMNPTVAVDSGSENSFLLQNSQSTEDTGYNVETDESASPLTDPTTLVDVHSDNENSLSLQNRSHSTEDTGYNVETDESASPLTDPTTPVDVNSYNENSLSLQNRSQSAEDTGYNVETDESASPLTDPTTPVDVNSYNENSLSLQNRSHSTEDTGCTVETDESESPLTDPTTHTVSVVNTLIQIENQSAEDHSKPYLRQRRTDVLQRYRMPVAHSDEFLDCVLGNDLLDEIAEMLGRRWTQLARKLNLRAQIGSIRNDKRDNTHDQAVEMLTKWKQERGKDATVKEIVKALRELNFNDIADDICSKMRWRIPIIQGL